MPDMLPKIVPENAERVVMLAPLVHQQVATYLAWTPQALLSAPDATSNVVTLQGSQLRPLSSASIIPNTCFTLPTHRDGVDLTDRPAPVADLVSLLPDVSDCRPRAENVVRGGDLASQFDSMALVTWHLRTATGPATEKTGLGSACSRSSTSSA